MKCSACRWCWLSTVCWIRWHVHVYRYSMRLFSRVKGIRTGVAETSSKSSHDEADLHCVLHHPGPHSFVKSSDPGRGCGDCSNACRCIHMDACGQWGWRCSHCKDWHHRLCAHDCLVRLVVASMYEQKLSLFVSKLSFQWEKYHVNIHSDNNYSKRFIRLLFLYLNNIYLK